MPPLSRKKNSTYFLPKSVAVVQDFLAAWLSEWIYFVDPVKPSTVPLLKSPGYCWDKLGWLDI